MKSTISKKQREIAKMKAKGLKNTEIGKVVYPNATPLSQRQLVSRELKKPNVAQYQEQIKEIAIKDSNITWKRITDAISDGLDSNRISDKLSAAKQARELLETKQKVEEVKEQITHLPNVDEIQLIRLMRGK